MQDNIKLQEWLSQYRISDDLAGTEQECKICGQVFKIPRYKDPKYQVCKKCKCGFTSQNRIVTEEQKEDLRLKSQQAWNNKSEDERKRIIEKRKESLQKTCENRTPEQKAIISKNISDVQKNFSAEKKQQIALKRSKGLKDSWSQKSETERTEIANKIKQSFMTEEHKQKILFNKNNRTPEQIQKMSERSRKNIIKLWKEKGPEITAKRQATIATFSEEKWDNIRAKQKATWQAKTEKERQESLEKFRQTMSTKTDEEKRDIRSRAVHKYEYEGECFDSSWELAFWIYAKDHNEAIERHPGIFKWTFEGQEHEYYPDFRYKGELVEIKGDQFFKENGDLFCPYDPTLDEAMKVKQAFMQQIGVKVLKSSELDYVFDYIVETYSKDYLNLFKKNLDFPYPKLYKTPNNMNLIQYFHKSIYKASRKGKLSPLEAWKDKNLIKKSALNRLKYVGHCKPSDILQGFNVAKIAPKVSVFKPQTAEVLIKKYLSDCRNIFDPFSGFSGRMLGAATCKIPYIGQDINEDHVRESNYIINYMNLQDCEVSVRDILVDSERNFDCLFTCPPYGGKEHWNENNDEVEKTCDEWIDICLEKYACRKYLFVVDQTEKYKDYIVDVFENTSHLGTAKEYVILIQN